MSKIIILQTIYIYNVGYDITQIFSISFLETDYPQNWEITFVFPQAHKQTATHHSNLISIRVRIIAFTTAARTLTKQASCRTPSIS